MSELLLDAAGRRRFPATLPSFHAGRPPRNKGTRYPADPPTVEEVVAVMRAAGETAHGHRLRGVIVVLWRAGLRISGALALTEADLDQRRGAELVRRGKGGRRREVGMDDWAWEQLQPWRPLGSSSRWGICSASSPARRAAGAGRPRPLAPSCVTPRWPPASAAASPRTSFATPTPVELAHEGVPLVVIQPPARAQNLAITSVYLQGIDNAEIIETVHARRALTSSSGADGGDRSSRKAIVRAVVSAAPTGDHDERADVEPEFPARHSLLDLGITDG